MASQSCDVIRVLTNLLNPVIWGNKGVIVLRPVGQVTWESAESTLTISGIWRDFQQFLAECARNLSKDLCGDPYQIELNNHLVTFADTFQSSRLPQHLSDLALTNLGTYVTLLGDIRCDIQFAMESRDVEMSLVALTTAVYALDGLAHLVLREHHIHEISPPTSPPPNSHNWQEVTPDLANESGVIRFV